MVDASKVSLGKAFGLARLGFSADHMPFLLLNQQQIQQ